MGALGTNGLKLRRLCSGANSYLNQRLLQLLNHASTTKKSYLQPQLQNPPTNQLICLVCFLLKRNVEFLLYMGHKEHFQGENNTVYAHLEPEPNIITKIWS